MVRRKVSIMGDCYLGPKHGPPRAGCRLTRKFAREGRYASEEENGEDRGQNPANALQRVILHKWATPCARIRPGGD